MADPFLIIKVPDDSLSQAGKGTVQFCPTKPWSPRMQKAFENSGADSLGLLYMFGWEPKRGLGFLSDLPSLRRLQIKFRSVLDPTPINGMHSLEVLDFEANCSKGSALDLAALTRLKTLNLLWHDTVRGLLQMKQLEALRLYDIGAKTFSLEAYPLLRGFGLRGAKKLERLDLACLSGLQALDIRNAPRLNQVTNVGCAESLKVLTLGNAKKVPVSFVEQFTALERLLLLKMGCLPELKLRSSPQLAGLWLGTTVVQKTSGTVCAK